MGFSKSCLVVFYAAVIAIGVAGFCARTSAQGLTGQISGSVTDPNGGAIADATVQIVSAQTSQSRSATTDSEGRFVFTELLPGTYALTIENPGFKKYEQTGISVTATERV
ncbi:MAG: carboxypeptidase regulatory-like domain-containing protein, partial [Acidobacteriaceae bacterium]|nr:carboxypeptidase regulatory-like domain-containing protein [Acidobacteriaceae bacterium]